MAMTDMARALTELLEPVAEAHGFELVAVEQAGGRQTPVIRVLLDREGGLDLDAICAANRWVSDAIDEADPVKSPYTLEVSSPGVDRPLRKREDFDRFAGETVTVKAKAHGSGVRHGRASSSARKATRSSSTSTESGSRAARDIVKARLKGVVSFDRERSED